MIPLTAGSVEKIMAGEEIDSPVLQVLGIKKLGNGERFRLLLSDGIFVSSFTMLTTALNDMINENQIAENAIIQVTRYALSKTNSGRQKQIMVLLEVDVKATALEVGEKIGEPKVYVDVSESDKLPPSAAAAAGVVTQPTSNTSGNNISTTPIMALSPYHPRWVIKARVSHKSDLRTWSNSRGEGKLFNMEVVDESGEIRCTAFREQAEKFYNFVELQKIYYISRGQVKLANKQFNSTKNDFEIVFNNETEILPCTDEVETDIPLIHYNFVPISSVEQLAQDEIVDIIGVAKHVEEPVEFTTRAGRELVKRSIQLIDESSTMITLTLWGSKALEFNHQDNPVVVVKSAKIGSFNSAKNLVTTMSSVIQVDPDLPEAHKLRGWFSTVGHAVEGKLLSKTEGGAGIMSGNMMQLDRALALGREVTDTAEYFVSKVTVNLIRHENAMYKACPAENCLKKVIENDNMYRCEKCDREYPTYKPRLLAHFLMSDWTDSTWATAFNDTFEKMIGVDAHEIDELRKSHPLEYEKKFGDMAFRSFMIKGRMKKNLYNDQEKLNVTAIEASPVDSRAYNKHLMKQIRALANVTK